MENLQSISLDLIDARQNNRETFDPVKLQQLADSIVANGLIQPIMVEEDETTGRFWLVAGERRYRASKLAGLATINAFVRSGLSRKASYLITLEENDNRQDTTDLEKAKGYHQFITDLGGTIEELCKATGKRVDYINRRLALLSLAPNIQELCNLGQLGLNYSVAMSDLDHNRQQIALRELRDNPSPRIEWFRHVCANLLADQQQAGFNFGQWIDNSTPAGSEETATIAPTMPDDPDTYSPHFDPTDMHASLSSTMTIWKNAGSQWLSLGYREKARQCEAIVTTLAAMLIAFPVVKLGNRPDDKIMRVFASDGCELATAKVYQRANLKKQQALPALDRLVLSGQLIRTEQKTRQGRTYHLYRRP